MFTLFKYLVWLVVLADVPDARDDQHQRVPGRQRGRCAVRREARRLRRACSPSDVGRTATGVRIRPGAVAAAALRPPATGSTMRCATSRQRHRGRAAAGRPSSGRCAPACRSLQNGQIGDEPVRVAALQMADPRNVRGDADASQVAETLNKRQALTEAMRTQAVALPQVLVLVVAILLIVYGYTYVLRPMQRLRALIDNRGSNDLSPLDPEAAPQRPAAADPVDQRPDGAPRRERRRAAPLHRRRRAPAAHAARRHQVADGARARRARSGRRCALRCERLAAGTEHATDAREPAADARARRHAADARRRSTSTSLGVVQRHDRRAPAARDRAPPRSRLRGPAAGRAVHRARRRAAAARDAVEPRRQRAALLARWRRRSPCRSTATPRRAAYTLAVSDTGPGMPADERERVFEPFYRGADVMAPGHRASDSRSCARSRAPTARVALSAGAEPRACDGSLLRVRQSTVLPVPHRQSRRRSRKVRVRVRA